MTTSKLWPASRTGHKRERGQGISPHEGQPRVTKRDLPQSPIISSWTDGLHNSKRLSPTPSAFRTEGRFRYFSILLKS